MVSLSLPSQLTSAELANLSLSRDAAVRAAVAGHPNTAPFILGELAAEFPAEVIGNPALPLLRLADPLLTHHWPDAALLALVRQDNAPGWIRKQALMHPKKVLQVALAWQTDLTDSEIQILARHSSWLVRARIAARNDLCPPLLEELTRDPHDAVRLAVVSRPGLSPAALHGFLSDPSRFVQQEARRQLQPHPA